MVRGKANKGGSAKKGSAAKKGKKAEVSTRLFFFVCGGKQELALWLGGRSQSERSQSNHCAPA
jgi:hypothetical protein